MVTSDDILKVLIVHADTGGIIAAEHCEPLAVRLEEILPGLRVRGEPETLLDLFNQQMEPIFVPDNISRYRRYTRDFIGSLREAVKAGEPLELM